MAEPVRTCVVTRQQYPREELVRLVAAPDGTVVVDYKARLPGRGAWLHPSAEALSQLDKKRRAIERALSVTVDPDAIREALLAAVLRAVGDGLSMAAASGGLVGGRDRLEVALAEQRVVIVAVACDVAERSLRGLERAVGDLERVALPWTTEELGQRLGRAPLAAVGVLGGPRNQYVIRQLRRLSALG